jgi:thiamine-phosphate pyrophosphorylase
MRESFDPTVYLVVDSACCDPHPWPKVVESAARGGVSMVQLRHKSTTDGVLERQVQTLRPILRELKVPLILNDHLELAERLEVDGLHLGQDDETPRRARERLGPRAIIGLSVTHADEIETVDPEVVDYVGLGPVFETGSKLDAAPAMGVEGFRFIRARLNVPVVAIGGVSIENAASLREAGADGLAVISAICRSPDPRGAAASLKQVMRRGAR